MKFMLFYGIYLHIYCAIMNLRCYMFGSIIYAIIMLWSAFCIFLVSNLTIRRVGVTGGIRIVFDYASMVLGYDNSFRYSHCLLVKGWQQVVTGLFVLAFLSAKPWNRSFMNIWFINMNWVFFLFNMALNIGWII